VWAYKYECLFLKSIPKLKNNTNTWKATGVDLVNYGIGMYMIHECEIDDEGQCSPMLSRSGCSYRYGQTASAELIDLVVTYRAASPP
jgi:hypothetical protein